MAASVAGPAFAIHSRFTERVHTIQDLQIAGFSDAETTTAKPCALGRRVGTGVTVGFGYEAVTGPLHIKPELRCTHSLSPAFDTYLFLHPTTNEAEFLLRFEFGGRH